MFSATLNVVTESIIIRTFTISTLLIVTVCVFQIALIKMYRVMYALEVPW